VLALVLAGLRRLPDTPPSQQATAPSPTSEPSKDQP
jgi:hypothetical protein